MVKVTELHINGEMITRLVEAYAGLDIVKVILMCHIYQPGLKRFVR